MEMRDEVLSSVGTQDLDNSSYQVSDLEDIDFNWEDPAVDMDSVYQLGIDTPFSLSIFDGFQMMGLTTSDPIKVEDEEDKENSAPTTTTTESEYPIEPPRLLRIRPFGTLLEILPDSVYRNVFR